MPRVQVIQPKDGFKVKIPFKEAEIHILSDVHIGAKNHAADLFAAAIEEIDGKRNARAILNGDLLEFVVPGGKISIRDQDENELEKQAEAAMDILEPIASKILFMRAGNHENRSVKQIELDVTYLICKHLGAPFYDGSGLTTVETTRGVCVLAGGHGSSGAANGDLELERLRRTYHADVYYLGHDHKLYAKPVPRFHANPDDGSEHMRESWFVRAGSFLRYGDYARNRHMVPERCGWAVVNLSSNGTIDCEVRT